MKTHLVNAGLPVKWMMMPSDDFRRWKRYREEAASRQWPVWPLYAYRVSLGVFIITGIN